MWKEGDYGRISYSTPAGRNCWKRACAAGGTDETAYNVSHWRMCAIFYNARFSRGHTKTCEILP